MKKIFLFAALAGIVFASCKKEASVAAVQNEGQQEITFSALSKAMTKGVLGGGDFATGRSIQVAGVMKTADGQYIDFLEAKTFRKLGGSTWQGAKWDEGTSDWASDPVYYPIGGNNSDFRFLAYSETTPATGESGTFARWYGSKQVELQVYDCAENEIVYSGFEGNKTTTAGATAIFKRTQALVSVTIKTKSGITYTDADDVTSGTIKINKIGFKDVKTSGALVLTIDPKKADASATAEWIYSAGCNCAFADMGSKKINGDLSTGSELPFETVVGTDLPAVKGTGTEEAPQYPATKKNALTYPLDATGFTLDRLFPAQILEAKTMVINYTLGENTFEVKLPLDGSTTDEDGTHAKSLEAWKEGKHYTYTITVNVNEILINPTAPAAWLVEGTAGQYDTDPAA